MKHKKILIPVLVLLLAVLAGLGVVAYRAQAGEQIEGAGSSEHADRPITTLTHDGKEYRLKKDFDTLLIVGTDTYENDGSEEAWQNYAQADFIAVLVFDNAAKTVSALQLNRDTICDVWAMDVLGQYTGTRRQHLALSHTYGSGYQDSCENVLYTVETLLFDAPVDHYMVFTMEAVPIVNDQVGGVTVTLEQDLTVLNPAYTKGSTQTLTGQDALSFVRVRMALGDTNNEARLGRHRAYIEGFITAANAAVQQNDALGVEIYRACGDSVLTDLDVNQISDVSKKLQEYTFTGIRYPEGYDQMGKRYNEFIVDEASLWNLVREMWCR